MSLVFLWFKIRRANNGQIDQNYLGVPLRSQRTSQVQYRSERIGRAFRSYLFSSSSGRKKGYPLQSLTQKGRT